MNGPAAVSDGAERAEDEELQLTPGQEAARKQVVDEILSMDEGGLRNLLRMRGMSTDGEWEQLVERVLDVFVEEFMGEMARQQAAAPEDTTENHHHHHNHHFSGEENESKAEKIKGLAADFLSDKPRKPTKGCCPPEKHKKAKDGTDTCPCPPGTAPSNLPADAPSDMSRQIAAAPAINCLILGDSGVGKTSFLKRHMSGLFEKAHEPTRSTGVAQIVFPTDRGWIKVHSIDTVGAGRPKLGGLDESYYGAIQSVILMFDVADRESYENATKKWYNEIQAIRPEMPKVLVGNKVDCARRVERTEIDFPFTQDNHHYFDLSVEHNVNIEIPFLTLLIEITGIRDLQLVESADQVPKEPRW